MITKRNARDLQPGDICAGTGETVVSVRSGLHTPKGKVEVSLLKDGRSRLGIWNASTKIGIANAE